MIVLDVFSELSITVASDHSCSFCLWQAHGWRELGVNLLHPLWVSWVHLPSILSLHTIFNSKSSSWFPMKERDLKIRPRSASSVSAVHKVWEIISKGKKSVSISRIVLVGLIFWCAEHIFVNQFLVAALRSVETGLFYLPQTIHQMNSGDPRL